MNPHKPDFRNRTEREKDSRLLEHYKQIGIASIAAAANMIRAAQPRTPVLATRTKVSPLPAAE